MGIQAPSEYCCITYNLHYEIKVVQWGRFKTLQTCLRSHHLAGMCSLLPFIAPNDDGKGHSTNSQARGLSTAKCFCALVLLGWLALYLLRICKQASGMALWIRMCTAPSGLGRKMYRHHQPESSHETKPNVCCGPNRLSLMFCQKTLFLCSLNSHKIGLFDAY